MCPTRRTSRICKPCARLTLFNRGTYLSPIMALRWLNVLLLSATLVSAPTMRPVVAIALGMPVGASSQLSCGPHGLVTPGTTAPMACAKSPSCSAMNEVRPSVGRLTGPTHTTLALFRWHAPTWHGADVVPETGPPKRRT